MRLRGLFSIETSNVVPVEPRHNGQGPMWDKYLTQVQKNLIIEKLAFVNCPPLMKAGPLFFSIQTLRGTLYDQ